MDHVIHFRDLFESIQDYRKIVLIIFLFQNDKELLRVIGSSESDITRVNLEFKDILLEQHDKYLDQVKNEEGSIIERFF